MADAPSKASSSGRRWSAMNVALVFLALLLSAVVIGAAVYRAVGGGSGLPTPTIPPDLATNFAFVSDLRGDVFSFAPGQDQAQLHTGDTIGAGAGALVQVGDNGWLRLGLPAGNILFVDQTSAVELRQLDIDGEQIAQLVLGTILVNASSDDILFRVPVETGAEARGQEALLGLIYDQAAQVLDLHCLRGACELAGRDGESVSLERGERAFVQGFDPPSLAGPARYELFLGIGDPGLVPLPTPVGRDQATATATPATRTPTPTPVRIEPTEPRPTFTPFPPIMGTLTGFPTFTPSPSAPTDVPSPTPSPTPVEPLPTDTPEATTATPAAEVEPTDTPPPTPPPAPTDTPLPAPTATSPPADTPTTSPPPTELPTETPAATATIPAATATPPAATATATIAPTASPTAPPATATPTPAG